MAIPGTSSPVAVSASLSFASGEGLRRIRRYPQAPIATSNSTPPGITFIGEDTLSFSLGNNQTLTIPFVNLPRRRPVAAPLQTQATTLFVPVGAQLQYSLTPTLSAGSLASCQTQALDVKNTVVTGPTILGHHLWREFRVVLTAGASGATGTVTGRLSLLLPVPLDSNRALRGIIG